MNFGQALEELKNGNRVSRSGWNGKGMFVYFVNGSTFAVNRPPLLGIYPEGTVINYLPHIDMKTADGSCVPWLASQTDILAEDWGLVTNLKILSGEPLRIMYDGINTDARTIAKLIKPGDLVAYYIDGRYAWKPEEIALFPHNTHVTITVLGNPADVADCEAGDLTPESAARWVIKQKARGYSRPTVYRSLNLMEGIRRATGTLIMGRDWDSWVADYDNDTNSVYPGSVAKQYKTTAGYDKSAVFDNLWPHRVVVHPPVPIMSPKWPARVTLKLGTKGYAVEALQKALRNSGIVGVRGIAYDGVFGVQTQTAVRNFEASEKLAVDSGIAGSQVRNELIVLGLLNSEGQFSG